MAGASGDLPLAGDQSPNFNAVRQAGEQRGFAGSEKQEAEFGPRKAYRECLNRTFAFLLIRGRGGRSPDAIADDALSACRAEERALAAFSEELMPIVKDRMKAWLVSGGHVPENLWW
jgi:hypothetical protein